MKIGNFEAYLIFGGSFRLDGGAMFGVVPKVLWEKKKPADEKNRISMCTNHLLLVNDTRKILVDTGNGYKGDDKFREIYGLDYSKGHLLQGLEKAGVKPEDITDVILTHLHFDHAGGATIRKNSGEIVPTFPNATYYVSRAQFEWALNPSYKDRASYFKENYVPLEEAGRLELINSGESPIEGIELIVCNGHTPGQLLPLVKDKQHPLFYAGDLIPMYPHVPIPWIMAYDNNPLLTIEEKKSILARAEKENWLIFFEHDPEIPLASIKMGEKNYEIDSPVEIDIF